MSMFEDALASIHDALTVEAEVLGRTLPVIDKTSGVELTGGKSGARGPSVHPACVIRRAVLEEHSLTPDDLVNQSITINGRTWRVINHQERPNPDGVGEYYLVLRAGAPSGG